MERSRSVYYIAFPIAVLLLCVFSYYLGWSRGKQAASLASASSSTKSVDVHEAQPELTYFKTLRATDEKGAAGPELEPSKTKTADASARSRAIQPPEEEPEKEIATGGHYSVQVSAFGDIGKAHELIDNLKNKGYQAFTKSDRGKNGDSLYRVYVGSYDSKSQALDTLEDLTQKGFGKGFVTTVGKR